MTELERLENLKKLKTGSMVQRQNCLRGDTTDASLLAI